MQVDKIGSEAAVWTVDPSQLSRTLDHLASVHGLEMRAADLRSAVEQALRSERASGWAEALVVAGTGMNFNLLPVRRSVREVLRAVTPRTPWVVRAPNAEYGAELLLVVDSSFRKVRVIRPAEGGKARWIPAAALREMLGCSHMDCEVDWVIGEPAAPLDPMRSPASSAWLGHPLRRLQALLRTERHDLGVVVVYSIAIGLLSLVLPIAVQSLVNTVAFGSVLQPIVVLTLFVFVALGFSSLMSSFRVFVVEIIQRRIFARVAADVSHRLVRVRADAFDKHHGPELVNRFFDVVTVQKSGALLLMDGLSLAMQTSVGLVVLALYHPWLLAFDLLLLVVMTYVVFGLGRGAVKTALKESKAKYDTAAWLEELASQQLTFKSAGGAEYAMDRGDGLVRDYLLKRRAHFRIVLRQVVGSLLLQALASSALLGIGGWLVIQRQLTLGQLVAAELIVTVVVGGFSKFGKKFETFYDLLAAIDKLGQLIDLPLERTGGEHLPPAEAPAAIKLHNVSFTYPDGAEILRGCSWEIRPGDRVGLLGPNGAGKSTLVELLYGLRQPDAGVVTIDGLDYRYLSLHSVREHIAVVHGPGIFTGTIFDNVTVGREGLGVKEVQEALETVGLLHDVQGLPDGLQTTLAISGRPLSPGKAARLLLARAVAAKPRLLILDDALDHLDDVEQRAEVCRSLFRRGAPWSVLCISESPEVLRYCNRLCRIRDGVITELTQDSLPEPLAKVG